MWGGKEFHILVQRYEKNENQMKGRQLWDTGARAPSTSNCLIFPVTPEPHKLYDIRFHVVAYPERI